MRWSHKWRRAGRVKERARRTHPNTNELIKQMLTNIFKRYISTNIYLYTESLIIAQITICINRDIYLSESSMSKLPGHGGRVARALLQTVPGMRVAL